MFNMVGIGAKSIVFGVGVGYIAKKAAFGLYKVWSHIAERELNRHTRNDFFKKVKIVCTVASSLAALYYNYRQNKNLANDKKVKSVSIDSGMITKPSDIQFTVSSDSE